MSTNVEVKNAWSRTPTYRYVFATLCLMERILPLTEFLVTLIFFLVLISKYSVLTDRYSIIQGGALAIDFVGNTECKVTSPSLCVRNVRVRLCCRLCYISRA